MSFGVRDLGSCQLSNFNGGEITRASVLYQSTATVTVNLDLKEDGMRTDQIFHYF